jgi:hypothetical protein
VISSNPKPAASPNQGNNSAPDNNAPTDSAPDDNTSAATDEQGVQPPGTEAPPFTAVAPAVPEEAMQGAFGCDAADPSMAPVPQGIRMLPIQSIVTSSPTVNEDASIVNNTAFAMDKPLDASQVTVDKKVTAGVSIDRPWGATTPFVGTEELQWKAENNAITLITPIKVDIRWGLLSAPNALDILTGSDSKLNKGNITTMIKSLQVTDAGRRWNDGDTNAWSSPITTKHELYHVEHLKRLFDQHLPDFQKAVNGKNIPAPWLWWSDEDKKRASFHINGIVTKARDALRDAVKDDFDNDGEKLAYQDCKNDYKALTTAMEAYGKQQNWL